MLVLSFNMVIFVIVIVVLVRHFRKRSKDHDRKGATLKLMLNITGVAFLFGLTWLFGALTFMNRQNAFQILFALTNSFQGFMIFIFFCILNSDVWSAWTRQLFGKRLSQLRSVTATKQTSRGQYRSEESETVVSEDVVTLGTPTKLVRTITRKGKHMVEVVKVKFDDAGGYDDSCVPELTSSEEINAPGGSVGWLKRTFSKQNRNTDDVAELKFNEGGGIDPQNPSEVTSQSESSV